MAVGTNVSEHDGIFFITSYKELEDVDLTTMCG